MSKTIKGEGYFYALLCDGFICGVYPSKKEAQKVAKEVKDCVCRHTIKRVKVKIIL